MKNKIFIILLAQIAGALSFSNKTLSSTTDIEPTKSVKIQLSLEKLKGKLESMKSQEDLNFLQISKRKKQRKRVFQKPSKKTKFITIETEDGQKIKVTEEEAQALALAQLEEGQNKIPDFPEVLNTSAKNFTLPSTYQSVARVSRLSPQTIQDIQDLDEDPFPKGVEMIEGKPFQTPIFMDEVLDSVKVKTVINVGNKNLKGEENFLDAHGIVETPYMYKVQEKPKMPLLLENGVFADENMVIEGPGRRAARKMYGEMSTSMKERIKKANEKFRKEQEKENKESKKKKKKEEKPEEEENNEEITKEIEIDAEKTIVDSIEDLNKLRFRSKIETFSNQELTSNSTLEEFDDPMMVHLENSIPKQNITLNFEEDKRILREISNELNEFIFDDLFSLTNSNSTA